MCGVLLLDCHYLWEDYRREGLFKLHSSIVVLLNNGLANKKKSTICTLIPWNEGNVTKLRYENIPNQCKN